MAEAGRYRIRRALDAELSEVASLVASLTFDEQEHYDHPKETFSEVEGGLQGISKSFTGENVHLIASGDDGVAGVCWCVLFDPGTGLEAEIAELVVRPDRQGEGIAGALLAAARSLFVERHVTFASVWTRPGNDAALAAYRSAGFLETEQTVLTWLPLEGR